MRAAHQVLDGASILVDPLAARILGSDNEASLEHAHADPLGPRLRWFIAARSRIAEDALRVAVEQGARQLVVLGAGLDTLAYRTDLAGRLRIIEIDHPATQAWKREKLSDAAIAVPDTLAFIPFDFERQMLADALGASGFDHDARTFFSWLGVVPYLTEQAVLLTLALIAGLPGGGEVVFDYVNPAASIAPAARLAHQALAEPVGAVGEQIQCYIDTEWLCSKLSALGFRHVDDTGPARLAARFFPVADHSTPARGGHIMHAATI